MKDYVVTTGLAGLAAVNRKNVIGSVLVSRYKVIFVILSFH